MEAIRNNDSAGPCARLRRQVESMADRKGTSQYGIAIEGSRMRLRHSLVLGGAKFNRSSPSFMLSLRERARSIHPKSRIGSFLMVALLRRLDECGRSGLD